MSAHDGFIEPEEIPLYVSDSHREQLVNVMEKIYRAHWAKELQVSPRAILPRYKYMLMTDLQPVLRAICYHSLPEGRQNKSIADAQDEQASLDEVARSEEAATHSRLEKERKRVRAADRVQRELGPTRPDIPPAEE